jgi:hypothetical protein
MFYNKSNEASRRVSFLLLLNVIESISRRRKMSSSRSSSLISSNEQQIGQRDHWQNELQSLGIESNQMIEFNEEGESEALSDNIKQVYYRDYKAALAIKK